MTPACQTFQDRHPFHVAKIQMLRVCRYAPSRSARAAECKLDLCFCRHSIWIGFVLLRSDCSAGRYLTSMAVTLHLTSTRSWALSARGFLYPAAEGFGHRCVF